MKYYIIAGEASGDLHASNLIRALKKGDISAQFRCWGGDLMQEQGAYLVKHYRDLAFMGFSEVAANIRTIVKNLLFCKEDLAKFKPDALILVDYPGFNLRIAEFAHRTGFKVFYYISPQVWAWKKSRIHKIQKFVDRMFVILPFEKEFYARYGYQVDFVGHPLLDIIDSLPQPDKTAFRLANGLTDKHIIALLPGSRKQEISRILPLMISVLREFPGFQFVVAGAPSIEKGFYQDLIGDAGAVLVLNQTHALLQNSFAALVTSGTATLETALFNVPEVVCYKGGNISYQIARRIIDKSMIKYISLVNLVMGKEVVKELIQSELSTANLVRELNYLISDESRRERIFRDYLQLKQKLGGAGASEKTATLILNQLS
jgi:lipid-A-disaccharide synthase